MKKLVSFLVAALGVFAIVSCEKEPDPALEIGSEADVVVESPATSYTFKFTTNQAWSIVADQSWISIETASGVAGDAEVVAAITANNTDAYRYANVTVTAGPLEEVYTVAQKPVQTVSEDKKITKDAQDITIAVNADADEVDLALESDWLQKNANASTSTSLVLSASANESTFAREVSFTVTNNGTISSYKVRQSGNSKDLTLSKIVYLGRKNAIYDNAAYAYNSFDEYAFVFESEDSKEVVLTVNAKADSVKATSVPAGVYAIDLEGKHAAGTFSVDSSVEYYTRSAEIETIVDGEISVAYENEVYAIVATLYKSEKEAETYSYEGAGVEITDESLGGQIYSVSYLGQYDTYFTPNQAKKWSFSLFISRNYDSAVPYIPYMTFNIWGDKSAEPGVLPEGTFTVFDPAAVETIESAYANGITNYKSGDLDLSGNDADFNNFTATKGGTVTITKQSDGRYTFKFDMELTVVIGHYDESYNWIVDDTKVFAYKPEITNVTVPAVDVSQESKPILDGDAVLGAPVSNMFALYWYGQKLGDDTDTFWGGFQNMGGFGGYTAQFGLTVANANYEYEAYVAANGKVASYSRTTYLPVGTYTFSSTPGDMKVVPVANGYIQNPYTGTKFYITGGSIKIEGTPQYGQKGTITYDLKATPGTVAKDETSGNYILTPSGAEASFTGSHELTWYRVSDRSTNTSQIVLFSVAK